MGTAEV